MSRTFSVSKAVVTGGARGIGAAIVERLAADGLDVVLIDRDGEAALQTAKELKAGAATKVVGLQCDVADRQQVSDVMAEATDVLGGLDTLVTNAGITRDGFAHRLSDDDWDAVLAVHLTGTFASIRAAAPSLRAEGPGRIVTISSISAAMGNLGQANYTAAKGGILSLTKTIAKEFARSGTTVNCVRPGFIDTAMTAAVPADVRAKLLANIPLQRAGRPEDVAAAVSYFVSDDASFVTGAVLDVNGGDYM